METIFGVTPALGGTMTLDGAPFAPRTPRDAIDAGVFLAPEDRKRHGLVLPMSVAENTSLPNVERLARWGMLDRAAERKMAETQAARLRTKTPSVLHKVISLSGGNQQKVVLGKWLAMNPRVLILDEPTRGIDVGAKAEIYRQIVGARRPRHHHPHGQLRDGGSDRAERSRRRDARRTHHRHRPARAT